MLSENELELFSFTMSPAPCMSAPAHSDCANRTATTHVYTGIPFQQITAGVDGQLSQREHLCFGAVFLFTLQQLMFTLPSPSNKTLLRLMVN